MNDLIPVEVTAKAAWEYRREELRKEDPVNVLLPWEDLPKTDRDWMIAEDRVRLRALAQMKPTPAMRTLEELRALLPRGLHNIGRKQRDLPEIVEVWL